MHIYIYIYMCVCVYIYIYIYIHTYLILTYNSSILYLNPKRRLGRPPGTEVLGKGQMGSALMGSLQISCFLTEGLFGYSR